MGDHVALDEMTVDFDPYAPAFAADPYPVYARLRADDPVHESPRGFWALSRHEDVARGLRDPHLGRAGFERVLGDRLGRGGLELSLLFRDPPDHTRLRALVSQAFTPRAVDGWRRRIGEIAAALAAPLADRDGFDVLADFSYPLAITVICEVLGVPDPDRTQFRRWSMDLERSLDAIARPGDQDLIARGKAAGHALAGYARGLIAERRRRPQDDLVSGLIAAEAAGDRLDEEELIATIVLLVVAGHETTANLIGNGLLALLRHPDQHRALRDDPALLPNAVEELLRWDGPAQRTGRIANADYRVGERTIPAGALVLLLLASANRDAARFPDADRLDVRRADTRHVGFGGGMHFCLGAPLARLEAHAAFAVLLRWPGLTLAAEPEWRPASALRGVKALPVTRRP